MRERGKNSIQLVVLNRDTPVVTEAWRKSPECQQWSVTSQLKRCRRNSAGKGAQDSTPQKSSSFRDRLSLSKRQAFGMSLAVYRAEESGPIGRKASYREARGRP